MKPEDIESESFRIILSELGPHNFSVMELPIVQRVIHATADFDYARIMRFSPNAITAGVNALRSGCDVYSDVQMIAAGVNQSRLERLGGQVTCRVNAPEVVEESRATGKTRSEIAMRQFGESLNGSIVAIGNAPTALFEIIRLYKEEGISPALVIGVPVGFVNAAESKLALTETALEYITSAGRKGGSTVAVSILNALLRLSGESTNA
jgi:precorrin-8X/cobalt-precorrin-8 methylmutase